MNKEDISTVTIPLETYMELIQKATINDWVLHEITHLSNSIVLLDARMCELDANIVKKQWFYEKAKVCTFF